jgi:hypothetical protein
MASAMMVVLAAVAGDVAGVNSRAAMECPVESSSASRFDHA